MATIATLDMQDYLATRPSILVGKSLVKISDLKWGYAMWAKDNGRQQPKPVSMGVALKVLYPEIEGIQLRVKGYRERFYRHQTPFLPAEPDDLEDLL